MAGCRRAKAAIPHLHDGRVGITGGGARFRTRLALALLDVLQFGRPIQGGLDSRFPLFRGTQPGRLPVPAFRARVLLRLPFQVVHPLAREVGISAWVTG
jgi:hypothetical protein